MIEKWKRFGKLVTTGGWEHRKQKNWKNILYGEFVCDCWQVTRKRLSDVKRGKVSSCGCLRKENTQAMFTTHGCCKGWKSNKLYKTYYWIIDRCTNDKSEYYYCYWWRWIKCLWASFEDFKKDMEDSYYAHEKKHWEEDTTIDRIDVNWDYCKENCRWATAKKQANNRRNNRYEIRNWKLMSISTIYEIANPAVSYSSFTSRYYKLWWPLKDCLYREAWTRSKDVLDDK